MLTNQKNTDIEELNKTISAGKTHSTTNNNIISLETRRNEKKLSDAKQRVREAARTLNW